MQEAKQRSSWRYSAKVGLTTPEVKEQANLIWEFRDQANNIRLFGPLGYGADKLQFDEYGCVVRPEGRAIIEATVLKRY